VDRVGVYLFRNSDDMGATYLDRLAEYGIGPNSGGCYQGTGGDLNWGSSFAPDDESRPWAHVGCYLDENNIANVRVTCDGAVYIGVLGRNRDLRALYSWAMGLPPDTGGMDGSGTPPGICVGGMDVY